MPKQQKKPLLKQDKHLLKELADTIWQYIVTNPDIRKLDKRPRDSWLLNFDKLQKYIQKHNKYPLTNDDKHISIWVSTQRTKYKYNSIGWLEKEILDTYNFIWKNVVNQQWDARFEELKVYLKKHNRYPTQSEYPQLSSWVRTQISQKDVLSTSRKKRLERIGFVWDGKKYWLEGLWLKQYKKLKRFVIKYNYYPLEADNKSLAYWVKGQRVKIKKDELSEEQIKKLDAINFEWRAYIFQHHEKHWFNRFNELKKFKANPTKEIDKNLLQWIYKQRKKYRIGKLHNTKIKALNTINFDWGEVSAYQKRWNEKLDELVKYLDTHKKYPLLSEHLEIATWIGNQRHLKNAGKLSIEKIKKLNSINFKWNGNLLDEHWQTQFEMLKHYLKVGTHYSISKFNKPLSKWVCHQRAYHREGKLLKDRVDKLNSIGFDWSRQTEKKTSPQKKHKKTRSIN